MTQSQWTAVDDYLTALLLPSDPILEATLTACEKAGLPPHQVSPSQGMLLQLLAQIQGARTILEIGTLGGYSTIWLARALPPHGHLLTIEANPVHGDIARTNFARAGIISMVDLRIGPALEILPRIVAEKKAPYDLIFLDADKPNNPHYLTWVLELTRSGSVIIADNVVRNGHVVDAGSQDPDVRGIRRFNASVAAHPRLRATIIQTVGCKGYDGFMMAQVT